MARFAICHLYHEGRGFFWPALDCVVDGGWVDGFACGWCLCCIGNGACVGWLQADYVR